jgi:hypothetical protein
MSSFFESHGLEHAFLDAAEALRATRAAGVRFAIEGDDVVLCSTSALPALLLARLSRHKAGIVALLRPGPGGWSADDYQVYFDERAGIGEFNGGLPRSDAEAQAFESCVIEWLNRNPVNVPRGRCLHCGGKEEKWDKLLPYGTAKTGAAWLHPRCWKPWHASRRVEAAAAVSKILAVGRCEGD